jgi:L-lactate utilization protein LutB
MTPETGSSGGPDPGSPPTAIPRDPNARWLLDKRLERFRTLMRSRGIESDLAEDTTEALAFVLDWLPRDLVVGLGGSTTLRQMGLWKALDDLGMAVVNQQLPGLTAEERHELRRRNVTTDRYVMSCNALVESGAIVVMNHTGNAVAALAFGARQVLIVASANKLVRTIDDAIARIQVEVAPANSHRSGEWRPPCYDSGICDESACVWPDRLCNKLLILTGEALPGRVRLLIVGEPLGF